VPEEVLVDNQKAVVLEHTVRGRPWFNERFLDLASLYGFHPRACKPARARTKGKDERTPALRCTQCGACVVGYIKGNFFLRYRSFESWAHLNQLAVQWLAEEADPRKHGTVKEVVIERYAREAPLLKPLPHRRYDTSYREIRRVAWDSYIDVRGNRHTILAQGSVPGDLVGRSVFARIGLDGSLRVFHGDRLIASHLLRPSRQGWVTVPEHHTRLWQEAIGESVTLGALDKKLWESTQGLGIGVWPRDLR
jgi:hypothetical protein